MTKKTSQQTLNLSVKSAGTQGKTFVTPGMMYNKA